MSFANKVKNLQLEKNQNWSSQKNFEHWKGNEKPPTGARPLQDNSPRRGCPSRSPSALLPVVQSLANIKNWVKSQDPVFDLVLPQPASTAENPEDHDSNNKVVRGNHPGGKNLKMLGNFPQDVKKFPTLHPLRSLEASPLLRLSCPRRNHPKMLSLLN